MYNVPIQLGQMVGHALKNSVQIPEERAPISPPPPLTRVVRRLCLWLNKNPIFHPSRHSFHLPPPSHPPFVLAPTLL